MIIKNEDLIKTGCNLEDIKNLPNLLRELVSVKMSVLIVQTGQKEYKISLRSKGDMDVSLIANKFGGGGHKNAAGFEISNLEPKEIIKKLIG